MLQRPKETPSLPSYVMTPPSPRTLSFLIFFSRIIFSLRPCEPSFVSSYNLCHRPPPALFTTPKKGRKEGLEVDGFVDRAYGVSNLSRHSLEVPGYVFRTFNRQY